MKRGEFPIRFVGPTGDWERWQVVIKPFDLWGLTDWNNKILTLDSHMRYDSQNRKGSSVHEIVHVTTGHNASEELAANIELNYTQFNKKLAEFLSR